VCSSDLSKKRKLVEKITRLTYESM